ncbi:hypothetical protein P280DRAFT_11699 [Massarina eburnea CBS 473.64]|uniref:Uncharacterized protein n=1 Tax=Massarina eburnea CBS 473.64 TaxID=1395130 RepID=A0A6A6SHH1_9PLEO|nr:hypothetical protein P280DRAFT_11699 [Massarina eburnea CBS 473.64]
MRDQSQAGRSNFNSSSIHATAHLEMTITIESRSRRVTQYRAVQRPDGVAIQARDFRTGREVPKKEKLKGADLAGVGAWAAETDAKCGRSGYNGAFGKGMDGHNKVYDKRVRNNRIAMERFHEDEGPWSTYDQKGKTDCSHSSHF